MNRYCKTLLGLLLCFTLALVMIPAQASAVKDGAKGYTDEQWNATHLKATPYAAYLEASDEKTVELAVEVYTMDDSIDLQVTYAWEKLVNADEDEWTEIEGETGSTCMVAARPAEYHCVVTDQQGDTRQVWFKVLKGKSIEGGKLTLKDASSKGYSGQYYTGHPLEPEPLLKVGGKTISVEDYDVTYKNNLNAGTATMTATGIGEYVGTCSCKFKIKPENIGVTNAKVKSVEYTGKPIKAEPKLTLWDVHPLLLIKGTDYTMRYKNNTKVGTARIHIYGKGNFNSDMEITFKIVPKRPKLKSAKGGKASVTAKWSKVAKQASGYQVSLATNKKFTKGKKTVTIKSFKTTKTKVSKLKAKKIYYVKVRTYKTVKGTKYYSPWSDVLQAKTK